MMREEITDSIEQIPYTIQNALDVSWTYDTETLQSHVSQLFVAALDLLQECLVWLRRNPLRKGLSVLVRGDDHSAALLQKQGQLKKLEARIDKHALVNLHNTVTSIHQGQKVTSEALRAIRMGTPSRLPAKVYPD